MGVTEERKQSVNFSDYYWSSEQVMVVRKDSPYANATSLEDFSGAKVTSQLASMWMDLIPQIPGVDEQPGMNRGLFRLPVQPRPDDRQVRRGQGL